jgi:hypothetical protein
VYEVFLFGGLGNQIGKYCMNAWGLGSVAMTIANALLPRMIVMQHHRFLVAGITASGAGGGSRVHQWLDEAWSMEIYK